MAFLGNKARSGRLSISDVQGGTLTMSNFGMGGALIGFPIIRYPESAIVGIGSIEKKVRVLSDSTFGVRMVMAVSLTFDHRVVDGMYGCSFVKTIKNYMENYAVHDF